MKLKGFYLRFAPKIGSGVTRIRGCWLHFGVLDFHSDKNNPGNVCLFLRHRMGKFVNFVRKLSQAKTTSGGRKKKPKLVFISSRYLERRYSLTVLCRKCVDKNDTLVRKLHEVRENFESSRKAIAEEKGGMNLNKMARARFR